MPYSGAGLYYGLSQVMVVRGGLGVLIGGCLGAVCLACGVAGVVRQFEDSCSRIFFCLFAMMPSSLVCASIQSLLRSTFAILVTWRRAVELVSGSFCPFPLRVEVITMSSARIIAQFANMGGQAQVRMKDGKALVTDNGQYILDGKGLQITDPVAFEAEVSQWPGVVTVGVFAYQKAHVCLLGTSAGVKTLKF